MKKSQLELRQTQIIKKNKQLEEKKTLTSFKQIQKQYNKEHYFLLKQINQNQKKTIRNIHKIIFKHKFKLLMLKILFLYKYLKDRIELRKNYHKKNKKIKNKNKIKIFLYRTFNIFFGT